MIDWLKRSLEDKEGHPDGAKVTALVAFAWVIVSAVTDQFTAHKPTEFVFTTLAYMAGAGLGISGIVTVLTKTK